LIAQKDNAENIRLADASVRMAEAGLRGNADMKVIATDAKTVALATLRDSAAMRNISVVTTFFLPATFTAVRSFPDFPGFLCNTWPTDVDLWTDPLQHHIFQLPEYWRIHCLEMVLALLADNGHSHSID